jgi:hypothetical protein
MGLELLQERPLLIESTYFNILKGTCWKQLNLPNFTSISNLGIHTYLKNIDITSSTYVEWFQSQNLAQESIFTPNGQN